MSDLLLDYSQEKKQCGLINASGKVIVELAHESSTGGKGYGFYVDGKRMTIVNAEGKAVRIVDGFKSYTECSEGYLRVARGEKTGYIALNSEILDIAPVFDSGRNFHGGVAGVEIVRGYQSNWGLIDSSGSFLVKPSFLAILDFTDSANVAPVQFHPDAKNRDRLALWGLINKTGDVVVPPTWAGACSSFFGGYMVIVMLSDHGPKRFGVVDENGNWKLPPEWDGLSDRVTSQTLGAKKNGKWGVIDLKGNWLIEPRFSYCSGVENGVVRAAVTADDGFLRFGLISMSGNWVLEPKYDEIHEFTNGFASFEEFHSDTEKVRCGYIDIKGLEIVPYQTEYL